MTDDTLVPRLDDEGIRELAYALWATDAGRSPGKVSQLLAADGYEVRPNTVTQWARRDSWGERLANDLFGALPAIRRQTAIGLVADGYKAQGIQSQLLADYERDGTLPDANMIKLIGQAMGFAGFSPVGIDKTAGQTGSSERRGAIAYLSEEELARIKRGDHR